MDANQRRAEARRRGVRMASRVAAGVGLVLAGAGIASASAAASEPPASPPALETQDDTRPLPFEGQVQVKSCGCTPCWGPPAPPRATRRSARARKSRRGQGRGR